MKTKSLITVALLAFIAVAVGFLVAKEIRTSEGIASPLVPKGAPLFLVGSR